LVFFNNGNSCEGKGIWKQPKDSLVAVTLFKPLFPFHHDLSGAHVRDFFLAANGPLGNGVNRSINQPTDV